MAETRGGDAAAGVLARSRHAHHRAREKTEETTAGEKKE
jgi:hypothetical protein